MVVWVGLAWYSTLGMMAMPLERKARLLSQLAEFTTGSFSVDNYTFRNYESVVGKGPGVHTFNSGRHEASVHAREGARAGFSSYIVACGIICFLVRRPSAFTRGVSTAWMLKGRCIIFKP